MKADVAARIAAAIAEVRKLGIRLTANEVRDRAGVRGQSVRDYFKAHGIKPASKGRAGKRAPQPCPTAIFFAAHRVKRATLEATKDRRRRPAPPSSVGYKPRVYRYTGEMLL